MIVMKIQKKNLPAKKEKGLRNKGESREMKKK